MKDLPGVAIYQYYFHKSRAKLFVHDTFGPKVEMPISIYFRDFSKRPILEKKALQLCSGKILDIGAGSGSHTLELQKTKEVFALEVSPSACEVMKNRGVRNIICEDIFKYEEQKFDTLLLLMNGIGLCGNTEGYRIFLKKAEQLLNNQGRIIFDSCDISYMYDELQKPTNRYFGELSCSYEFQKQTTDWFSWLYLDKETMSQISKDCGWNSEIIFEDSSNQYLVMLTKC